MLHVSLVRLKVSHLHLATLEYMKSDLNTLMGMDTKILGYLYLDKIQGQFIMLFYLSTTRNSS